MYPEAYDIYDGDKGDKLDSWLENVIHSLPKKKKEWVTRVIQLEATSYMEVVFLWLFLGGNLNENTNNIKVMGA